MIVYAGLNIIPHELATKLRIEYVVVRHSLHRKRRKNWTVQRYEYLEPSAWQVGATIYMHPSLYSALKEQIGASNG